ncbi:MAG TPA: glycosyltransferase family 4 protein [Verrucomicrobiae bacterium]|nr:glycosyltransferase family 4 protein [Verrucomicrobiae bacterium]
MTAAAEFAPARPAPAVARRLRLLVVSHSLPFPPRWGYATRVYQLLRQLSIRHDVTLLTYAAPGAEAVCATIPGVRVEIVRRGQTPRIAKRVAQAVSIVTRRPFAVAAGHSTEMQRAIDRLFSHERFDLVQVEGAVLTTLRFPDPSRVVLDEHNIDYEVFERMHAGERSRLRRFFYRSEMGLFRDFEHRIWSRVGGCVVTSEREAAIVRAHAPNTAVEVVPNGVDLEYFAPGAEGVASAHTIVFNGALDYRPNVDAAIHLVQDVLPLLRARYRDVQVTIVGRSPSAEIQRLAAPDVSVVGEVADVRPSMRQAGVVAVPIRMGGGTRFKVIEALALARPVVSTTIGCEGISVVDGEHLLIGDTATTFAQQIARIFDDRDLAARIAMAGRALIEREYSWDLGGRRLEGLYREVACPSPRRVA